MFIAGKAAVNFEHAWGDGVAVLRYFNEVFKETTTTAALEPALVTAAKATSTIPKKLAFSVSSELNSIVKKADADFAAARASVDLEVVQSQLLGAKIFKSSGIGTDGAMQMLMQLAHYKMYGKSAATYESASTSGFKHGRTETIRSATVESVAMCKGFEDETVGPHERFELLKVATKKHGAITKDALMGKGWDRHLFALRLLAEEKGNPPHIFADPSYGLINNIILSTSTLSSPALQGGGFGPSGRDCYGISYGHEDALVQFGIMSYKRKTKAFAQALIDAISDFHKVIECSECGRKWS